VNLDCRAPGHVGEPVSAPAAEDDRGELDDSTEREPEARIIEADRGVA
jgi:hypothetical protein